MRNGCDSCSRSCTSHSTRARRSAGRQMRIVLLQELGERDQAIRLLAELLAGDAVRDRAERRFLLARLRELAPHHPLLFEDPT